MALQAENTYNNITYYTTEVQYFQYIHNLEQLRGIVSIKLSNTPWQCYSRNGFH